MNEVDTELHYQQNKTKSLTMTKYSSQTSSPPNYIPGGCVSLPQI